MKRVVNQEELKVEWSLDHWYEKAIYVIGYLGVVLYLVAFIVAFVAALATGEY